MRQAKLPLSTRLGGPVSEGEVYAAWAVLAILFGLAYIVGIIAISAFIVTALFPVFVALMILTFRFLGRNPNV